MKIILGLILSVSFAFSQDAPAEAELSDFDKTSLNLRTALHYDSAIAAPLDSLVRLYQKEDRIEDLIGLYQAHIAQYPEDAGAKAVLTRLLRKLNRAGAGEFVTAASQLHPDNSVLQHLLFQHLQDRNDPRAVEVLSRAIELELLKPGRRDGWLEELLKISAEGKGRELAIGHLTALLNLENHTAKTLEALSARMQRYGFWELSLSAVTKALAKDPDAEAKVELQVQAAKAEASLGNREPAGQRLDGLLAKLAPDYWRRREIMSLRVNFLANDAEREAMLATAKAGWEANPASESAVLDYVELLAASELRRDAIKVLNDAAVVLPTSERLEAKTLELLERIGDERELEVYLEKRLAAFSERDDLRYRIVKAQYLLGKTEPAEVNFKRVMAGLSEEDKGPRLLDLGRYLRNSNLPGQAVPIFETFLATNPARLDVRRELAETHLTLDQKSIARKVVGELDVTHAEIENFLDVVQFMVREEFFAEAKKALEKRLGIEPEQFELRLLLTRVFGKTGDREAAESLLNSTREIADTPSRYRSWLETGLEVHELFDDVALFFDREQARFGTKSNGGDTAEKWTSAEIEKFLILCETGERSQLTDRVTQAIRTKLLTDDLALDVRLKLRLLLVTALGNQPERGAEIEEQLKLLAIENPSQKDEYTLRLALLYHSLNRPDLTSPALSEVTVSNVSDVSVLRAAAPVFIEFGLVDAASTTLERVTAAEPEALANWEKRLSLLAALGREIELRKVIRDLLGGVNRIELSVDSIDALRRHLLDSHWRSVASLIAKQTPESLAEVLPLLESVQREATDSDRLWGLWARAFVLNALDRVDARDAAIEELTAAAYEGNANAARAAADAETQIVFPDGLAISLPAAMDLLTGPTGDKSAAESRQKTEGPLTQPKLDWAFEVDGGARVLQIEPVGKDVVLILDDRGTMYSVEAASGKLKWRERFGLPETTFTNSGSRRLRGNTLGATGGSGIQIANQYFRVQQSGSSLSVQQLVAPFQTATLNAGGASVTGAAGIGATGWDASSVKLVRRFATDGESQFFMTFGDEISAFEATTGKLSWNAHLGALSEGERQMVSNLARPETSLAIDGERLIAFSPATSVASGFSAENGKLLWQRTLNSNAADNLFSLNSGMTVDGGRVFLFGSESVILDSQSGDTIWKFDGVGVQKFPVKLRAQEKAVADELAAQAEGPIVTTPTKAWAGGSVSLSHERPGMLDHLTAGSDRKLTVKSFTKNRGALVAPAVYWSASRIHNRTPSAASLDGDRLLLMDQYGIREISLRFPLASRQIDVSGTFLGTAGDNAWFLERDSIVRVDLGNREMSADSKYSISLAGLALDGESSAVMSGSRVYVTGPGGMAIFNAHSGRVISESRWPEELEAYRTKFGGSAAGITGTRYVIQGLVRSPAAGYAAIANNPVERTSGSTLYSKIGESSVVALRGE